MLVVFWGDAVVEGGACTTGVDDAFGEDDGEDTTLGDDAGEVGGTIDGVEFEAGVVNEVVTTSVEGFVADEPGEVVDDEMMIVVSEFPLPLPRAPLPLLFIC